MIFKCGSWKDDSAVKSPYQKTQVQFPTPIWQLKLLVNSVSRAPDTRVIHSYKQTKCLYT